MNELTMNELLFEAAKTGNLIHFQTALESGADINEINPLIARTPLMEAALHGRAIIARELIDRGAEVNAQNLLGDTALIYAARKGSSEIASLLIQRGANVSLENKAKLSPLKAAVEISTNIQIIDLLFNNGLEANLSTQVLNEAFHKAVLLGELQIAERLSAHGADTNSLNSFKLTALQAAAKIGHLPLAQFLIDNNLNSMTAQNNANKAFALALNKGHDEVVSFLYVCPKLCLNKENLGLIARAEQKHPALFNHLKDLMKTRFTELCMTLGKEQNFESLLLITDNLCLALSRDEKKKIYDSINYYHHKHAQAIQTNESSVTTSIGFFRQESESSTPESSIINSKPH